jgi:divalent metal cation (Fe/Co/Zn/Cd) transporter
MNADNKICGRQLADTVPLSHLGWVAVAGAVGFLGNEVVAVYRIRVGKRIGSAALRADGMHARADGLTSLAVVAGAIGAALGFPAADPIVGLVIAGAIGIVLTYAARDVFGRLLDRVDPSLSRSDAHSLAHNAEHEPGHSIPRLSSVIVHAYPAHPAHHGALSI